MKRFLAGLLVGGFAMLLAMSYHIVNTNQGYTLIPRANQPPFRSVYLDARSWTLEKSKAYPEFVEAAVKAGRAELLLQGSITGGLDEPPAAIGVSTPAISVADQTRQAIRALVPINFTDEQGNTSQRIPAVDPIVPVPVEIVNTPPAGGLSPAGNTPAIVNSPATAPTDNVNSTTPMDPLRQVLSALGNGGNSSQTSIPGTEHSLPGIGQVKGMDQLPQSVSGLQQKLTETLPKGGETQQWMQGVMKSLVNGDNDTAVPKILPQQSLAHPKVGVEAPNPGSSPVFPNIFFNNGSPSPQPQAPQPQSLPSIKAF